MPTSPRSRWRSRGEVRSLRRTSQGWVGLGPQWPLHPMVSNTRKAPHPKAVGHPPWQRLPPCFPRRHGRQIERSGGQAWRRRRRDKDGH
jgi:hypothetical protein